ncbi:MAG: hypothetical protein Q4B18_01625 [Bacillota bacterium]|nr:hypothetical protein [Bacillota bacterium]
MSNFWDYSNWGTINIVAVLLLSLIVATVLKNLVPILHKSLIPTSVLGGFILLIIAGIYKTLTGNFFFDTAFFAGQGMAALETITYHALALGFTASALKSTNTKMTKRRTMEIFDSGVTTVAVYLVQAILGMGITIIAAMFIFDFFPAAGILVPFGFGQGSGQAMNFGGIFEADFGFVGGKSFGLTIAALGFLSASIGGVIHLNILKKRGKLVANTAVLEDRILPDEIEEENEIPMQGSMDKMTVQVGFICGTYLLAYAMMFALGIAVPGFKATIYGFNFILGVLAAVMVKAVLKFLNKKSIVKRRYTNNFLLTRCSNFFFDIMIVAGIAAIRLSVLEKYWGIMLVLGVVAAFSTYFYVRMVSKKLFPRYVEEQFLAMYGMLTGTASTGVILLREIDPNFDTPAADNLVYQTFPAIAFGFPMMLLATFAPREPITCLIILIAFFAVMNIILFRRQILRVRRKKRRGKAQ